MVRVLRYPRMFAFVCAILFACAALGDAKDNPKATYHLTTFADLLEATK